MKKVVLLVSVLLSIGLSGLYAQNEEYFTAFEGIPFAKEYASKNIQYTSILFGIGLLDPFYNNEYKENKHYDGKALNWVYGFSYNNGKMIRIVSIEKISGEFKINKTEDLRADTLYQHNFIFGDISHITQIADSLKDSDFKIQLDESPFNEEFTILSDNNNNLVIDKITLMDSVWSAEFSEAGTEFPSRSWPIGIYIISAIDGSLIYYNVIIGDVNEDNYMLYQSVSPNPTTDFIKFDIDETALTGKVEIFTTTGLKVMETEFIDKIYVGTLTPGMYFIKRYNIIGKFVKM